MDTIPSAKFRKSYASLTVPVQVTVNGHVIGTWDPRVMRHDDKVLAPLATIFEDGVGGAIRRREPGVLSTDPRIGADRNPSHEFNPAPKPSQRRK